MLLKMKSWVDSALCFDKYHRPSGYMHTENCILCIVYYRNNSSMLFQTQPQSDRECRLHQSDRKGEHLKTTLGQNSLGAEKCCIWSKFSLLLSRNRVLCDCLWTEVVFVSGLSEAGTQAGFSRVRARVRASRQAWLSGGQLGILQEM